MTRDRKSLEKRLAFAAGLVGVPPSIIAFLLLFWGDYSWLLIITVSVVIVLCCCIGVLYVYRGINNHLLTLANLVEGIRHNDYSFRLNLANKSGAALEVSQELNLLVENLQQKQLAVIESSIALDKLIEQIDIPVLVIDASGAVQNSNHFAALLFNQSRQKIMGLSVEQLKIETFLKLPPGAIVEHRFPAQGGRWEVKSKIIVSGGKKYRLLVISDISRALRLEERNAWARIIRVIGHELNNSLTSISSLAETLLLQLNRQVKSVELSNMHKGLKMIIERGDSLQRFMTAYASVAKLPSPSIERFLLQDLLSKVAALHPDSVILKKSEEIFLFGDQDQLQAALINLVKNGLEAGTANNKVIVAAERKYQGVIIQVIDDGPGVANQDNLFVPFYTTKDGGSGIGLVLSREIAEAHKGTLKLCNRAQGGGCVAEVWLPIAIESSTVAH